MYYPRFYNFIITNLPLNFYKNHYVLFFAEKSCIINNVAIILKYL